MTALSVLFGLMGFLLAAGLAESLWHRRNLARVPIRIHVNGTRGKSSVTRLIAAGLRGAGLRTFAKTTGTLPRMILPDGSEVPVVRESQANVMEQREIVREAARHHVQALVVECMALQPWLQWICESKLVRATHGVITNAWADHLDVMGPEDSHVASALANMTPRNGVLLTAEQKHRRILRRAAKDRGSRFVAVGEADFDSSHGCGHAAVLLSRTPGERGLGACVCAELGIDRETALAGMCRAVPDPGATATYELEFWGREIHFVSAFAANDPTATERLWHASLQSHSDVERRIALFNCRSDRLDRSRQLAQACVDWEPADHYVLIGTGTQAFLRFADAAGLSPRKVLVAEGESPTELFETLIDLAGQSALIVGMGNIGDNGLEIARFFRNRSRIAAAPVARFAPIPDADEPALPDEWELQAVGAGGLDFAPARNGKSNLFTLDQGR